MVEPLKHNASTVLRISLALLVSFWTRGVVSTSFFFLLLYFLAWVSAVSRDSSCCLLVPEAKSVLAKIKWTYCHLLPFSLGARGRAGQLEEVSLSSCGMRWSAGTVPPSFHYFETNIGALPCAWYLLSKGRIKRMNRKKTVRHLVSRLRGKRLVCKGLKLYTLEARVFLRETA